MGRPLARIAKEWFVWELKNVRMDPGGRHIPNLPLRNPFSIRIHLIDKPSMRQHLSHHFGVQFANAIMDLDEPVIYPVVSYREEWECIIFVLY